MLEAGSLRSRCQQGWFPSEVRRESLRQASLPAPGAAGQPGQSLTCRHLTLMSASICTSSPLCLCPLLVRIPAAGHRAHLITGLLQFHPQRWFCHMRDQGLGLDLAFVGGPNSTHSGGSPPLIPIPAPGPPPQPHVFLALQSPVSLPLWGAHQMLLAKE